MGRKLRVKLITIPWELEVPTLTLASLAAVTPESRFDVSIVDTLRARLILDEPTDLVGISASTPRIDAAYALAEAYRRRGVRVVIGGHHVTAMPDEALQHADAVVCGEGETSWIRILDQMLGNPLRVSGIYRDVPPDLATLPQPRTDLMKLDRYSRACYPVIASRGCPMSCSFCFSSWMTPRYRTYPIAHVLEQVARRPRRFRFVYFVDDNLAGDLEYARELFRQLKRFRIQFAIQVRHEFSRDPENVRLAWEAGCVLISSGYESINQQSLDGTGKRARAASYRETISNIQREGVIASGNWIFGFDWDTPDVFAETWEFLRDSGILHCSFTTEIPFPGTPTFNRYRREGRILTTDYSRYLGHDNVVFRPKQMTPEQLRGGIRWLTRRFYSPRHRHHLTRSPTGKQNLKPWFHGQQSKLLLALMKCHQVMVVFNRFFPGARLCHDGLVRLNKYRYPRDLLRGTNFCHRERESPRLQPVAAASGCDDRGLRRHHPG